MAVLAPFITAGEKDVKIDDTCSVFLKKELVPTKEIYNRHIRWLEEEVLKNDSQSRLELTSFIERIECMYEAELSKEALLKVRQREDVELVCENFVRKGEKQLL